MTFIITRKGIIINYTEVGASSINNLRFGLFLEDGWFSFLQTWLYAKNCE